MTFEFILLALLKNDVPVEISRYEDTTPFYCLQDAATLNDYVENNYVFEHDMTAAKNWFIENLNEYEAEYGRFLSYTPDALDLTTQASKDFYDEVYLANQPRQSAERINTMSMEQSLKFTIVLLAYKSYVDKNEENKRHQIFKDILNAGELSDKTTMLTEYHVRYVCLPAPR